MTGPKNARHWPISSSAKTGGTSIWQALAAYRLGDTREALVHARRLQQLAPNYPQLDKLLQKLPPERR